MEPLIILSTLFVLGSLVGYIIELFFRRFVSQKKWVNPGFLVGPYIPVYGFGVLILYAISAISLTDVIKNVALAQFLMVLLIGISLTLIELIAGLIFIKGFHIKLWDYSDRWLNFKGIICPLFSLIWFAVGCLYYFLINPYLVQGIEWLCNNQAYSYFIGAVIGAMIIDACYSFSLGIKIKKFSGDMVIKYEQFKVDLKDKYGDNRFFGALISLETHSKSLGETIKNSVEKLPNPTKWWKRDKKKDKDKA